MTTIAARNSFRYSIRSTPALNLQIDELTMVGDARDMERGVLLINEHSRYLPVQAIPQEMAEPDLIVDVADGSEILTTLHFCTIWQSIQQSQNAETWERVSFPTESLAFLYNDIRLPLCRACQHLHKGSCMKKEREAASDFFGTRNCFLVTNLAEYEAFIARHMCRLIRRGERVGFQKGNRQLPRNLCPEREDFGPFLLELSTFLVPGETVVLFSFFHDTEYSMGGGFIEAFAYVVDSQGTIRKYSLDAVFAGVSDTILCQPKP